ncbi:RecT family recombinase [Paraburkholderia sediminicola]|uniref:RecT family recombinase n=1 Tax=Paraburkholderia sediminicola TaxID=458836 RepID=UPI0038B9D82E
MRALQVAPEPTADFPGEDTSSAALILSGDAMDRAIKFADIMATGRSTVPKHLQGNRGDCLAVTIQAMQWGMMPFAVAQKTHVVSGTLGYEAQLVNAVITARAPVTGRINYEWFGDWDRIAGRFKEVPAKNNPDEKRIVRDWTIKDEEGLGVRVWATFKGETEPRELRLLLAQAGTRNSPLWGQDPKQQLAYLAVKRWSRLYCPDVILGVYTPDELDELPKQHDMGAAEVLSPEPSEALVNEARAAANKGVAAYQTFWASTTKDNRKLLATEHETLKATALRVDAERTVDNGASSQAASQQSAVQQSGPTVTFADVMSSMQSAVNRSDLDALNAAADMIRSVTSEDERNELSGEYRAFVETIEGAAQ